MRACTSEGGHDIPFIIVKIIDEDKIDKKASRRTVYKCDSEVVSAAAKTRNEGHTRRASNDEGGREGLGIKRREEIPC